MSEPARWLIVEDAKGDWQIDCEPGRTIPGRILCTFLSYASAQETLAEYHAGLWNAVIPF
jgi:hypothetical protein